MTNKGPIICSTEVRNGYSKQFRDLLDNSINDFDEGTFRELLEKVDVEELVCPNTVIEGKNSFFLFSSNTSILNIILQKL